MVIYDVVTLVRSVFGNKKKYYPQLFSEKCLNELAE